MTLKRKPKSVVLRIPTKYVYSFPTSLLSRSEWRKESVRNFCIEQYVPLDAEEIESRQIGGYDSGLVLAVHLKQVNNLVEKQEQDGNWIGAIVPEFLLSLSSLLRKEKVKVNCEVYIEEDFDTWNYGSLQDGTLVLWEWMTEKEVANRLAIPCSLRRLVVASKRSFDSTNLAPYEYVQSSNTELADDEEFRILQGSSDPMVDFRGPKVRTRDPFRSMVLPLATLLYALVVACLIASVLFFETARRVNDVTTSLRIDQAEMFRKAFPEGRIPVDIVTRLRSETKKAETNEAQAQKTPRLEMSFDVFKQFLAAIPDSGDFRIESIRFDGTTISSCRGIARSLGDFQTLVAALQASEFSFPNPSLNQLGDSHYGFQFESMRKTSTKEVR